MAESPLHYTRGQIEVWDFIRDQGLGYHRGNAIKYICRAGFKGIHTEIEDLKKAIHYLENELQHTTLHLEECERSSNRVPLSIWNPEQSGESDYAVEFDR